MRVYIRSADRGVSYSYPESCPLAKAIKRKAKGKIVLVTPGRAATYKGSDWKTGQLFRYDPIKFEEKLQNPGPGFHMNLVNCT